MNIDHVAIAARLAELTAELQIARARHAKEWQSLAEMCAGLGHQFGAPVETWAWHFKMGTRSGERVHCACCGEDQWLEGSDWVPDAPSLTEASSLSPVLAPSTEREAK